MPKMTDEIEPELMAQINEALKHPDGTLEDLPKGSWARNYIERDLERIENESASYLRGLVAGLILEKAPPDQVSVEETSRAYIARFEQQMRIRLKTLEEAKAEGAKEERERARAIEESALKALKLVEFGSCDACGSGSYCAWCTNSDVHEDNYWGTNSHRKDCPVAAALSGATRL